MSIEVSFVKSGSLKELPRDQQSKIIATTLEQIADSFKKLWKLVTLLYINIGRQNRNGYS